MPRKYEPIIAYEYIWGDAYRFADMRESRYGQWVPLRVYLDETARLRKQIERLENKARRLSESIPTTRTDG